MIDGLRRAATIAGTAMAAAGAVLVAGHSGAVSPQTPPCVYQLQGALPDPSCTPGAIDPSVTQETIAETICQSGYTARVRPPVGVTNALKAQQMAAYGVGGDDPKGYEEDHLTSLELGGAAADPSNLWPEPYAGDFGARRKDRVENAAHAAVCAGTLSLADAQAGIAANWIDLGQRLGVIP